MFLRGIARGRHRSQSQPLASSTPPKKKHVGYYADDEKAALAYNKAVSDAGLAGVRELNRVDASGRPVPKSRAAQFTVTIHGGRD